MINGVRIFYTLGVISLIGAALFPSRICKIFQYIYLVVYFRYITYLNRSNSKKEK